MPDNRWQECLPTKRELGIGYLAGVGVALALSLIGYIWFTRESVLVVMLGTTLALAFFVAVLYIGYLFFEVGFSDRFVWNVAEWTALGLGVAALISFGVTVGQAYLPASTLIPSLLVILIGSGCVIGTLIGTVTGLREQHRQMRSVMQRNQVMNRVLRHNIKNAMNIVQGHASVLAEEADLTGHDSFHAITNAVEEVVSLSDAARKIDSLTDASERGPVDASEVADEYVEKARSMYPHVDFTVTLPDSAWVRANHLLEAVLANLVENAVEHHDGRTDPDVRIRVQPTPEGEVEIAVADNGPGIPQGQRDVLQRARESSIAHGDGLGLWLVKWIVEGYGGELWFEENDPRGSVVRLRLPGAGPDQEDDHRKLDAAPNQLSPTDIR